MKQLFMFYNLIKNRTARLWKPVVFATFTVFSACESETYFDIGKGWVDTNLKTVFTDTCSVLLSTVKGDSIDTHARSCILAGKYNDVNALSGESLSGLIKTVSYVELVNPGSSTNIENNDFFDSIVIEMRFNGFYMGDTLTSPSHLYVYRLAERIHQDDVESGSEVYYNTTTFATEPTPLAEAVFAVRPSNRSDTINSFGISIPPVRIRLPDALGQDFFDKIKDKATELDNSENFLNYFNGLAFVPDDDCNIIAGFKGDTTFKVVLHYHRQEDFKTEKRIVISASTTNQFNNISADRSGTLLNAFVEDEISSELTLNQSYIAAGDALYTKINFPTLNQLLLLDEYMTVQQAILQIKPISGTYDESTLPTTLSVSVINDDDETVGALYNSSSEAQTGDLSIDFQYPEKTVYTFDVTSFVQDQMTAAVDEKKYLLLKFTDTDMKTTTKRLILGDSKHEMQVGSHYYSNKATLSIYYDAYNNKK